MTDSKLAKQTALPRRELFRVAELDAEIQALKVRPKVLKAKKAKGKR